MLQTVMKVILSMVIYRNCKMYKKSRGIKVMQEVFSILNFEVDHWKRKY